MSKRVLSSCWCAEQSSLRGATNAFERITNEKMLVKPCDMLIPCTASNTVHLRLAHQLTSPLPRRLPSR